MKAIGRRDRRNYERLMAAIRALVQDPRPPGVRKLSGRESYRVRVGDYRVIYLVDDEEQTLTVLGVGHRRDVYDR
ncbi:MAG: type II toxin-antitoxin system RelE/ParE family toxin [Actinomycetota bacterium]|nr:type II toxin-antitoxin system RelE/ParE family toxin [Actinomycetota bacterium]